MISSMTLVEKNEMSFERHLKKHGCESYLVSNFLDSACLTRPPENALIVESSMEIQLSRISSGIERTRNGKARVCLHISQETNCAVVDSYLIDFELYYSVRSDDKWDDSIYCS